MSKAVPGTRFSPGTLDKGEQVTVQLGVTVTGEQYRRWRAQAFSERKSLSNFIRDGVEIYLRAVTLKKGEPTG